ncbi:serine protease [Hymenobacter negativus]|uniref:Trypsin-like peptidase domain-containing protein n=1 Tax=Hymenobacter negativus TaxID=2795026 RepID=A0ABS3QCK1_9BACT|nr:serine protease [Hymenobacter negativus]MBO2008917.1 trypsin-like peptidase domain-containing protein [Hymenobacter negativus]
MKLYFRTTAFRLLASSAILSLAACNGPSSQTKEAAAPPVKNWMAEPFTQSPQVLLANGATFADGQHLDGASAFLVQVGQRQYALTANHLLGADGGIEPTKKRSLVNGELVSWKLFARQRATDTVRLDKLLNAVDSDSSDALVFSIKGGGTGYQALTPRYDAPAQGEEVYLIGCPYAEADCTQNRYPVRVEETSDTEYLLAQNESPTLSGFSGCPVVDKQGRVIGLLSFTLQEPSGKKHTMITPIGVVKRYLQE